MYRIALISICLAFAGCGGDSLSSSESSISSNTSNASSTGNASSSTPADENSSSSSSISAQASSSASVIQSSSVLAISSSSVSTEPHLALTPIDYTDLASGDSIAVEIVAVNLSTDDIKQVNLYLDGAFLRKETLPPYEWPDEVVIPQSGQGELKAIALLNNGGSLEASFSIDISVPAPSSSSSSSEGPVARGKLLYEAALGTSGSCASCHGAEGEGVLNRGGPVKQCINCSTFAALESKIAESMPIGNSDDCSGQCATDIASYIWVELNEKEIPQSLCGDSVQKASPMRRYNRTEIGFIIDDLFGTAGSVVTDAMPIENEIIGGFATVGSALTTSSDWTDNYINALIDGVDIIVDQGHFTADCSYSGAAQDCFRNDLSALGRLAYRRSLTTQELDRLALIYEQTATSETDNEALKSTLIALLGSPKFLFLIPEGESYVGRDLSQQELATRLSLTLWGSIPDTILLNLAAENKLLGAELDSQIERMINHEKFTRFFEVFMIPWAGLENYALEATDLNITESEWQNLLADMKAETQAFMAHLIKENRPVSEIYTADYSFVNQRLADHYGFSGQFTDELSRFNYPVDSHRRGIMTHAGVLAKAFDGEKTSVVRRGVTPLTAFTCTAPRAPDDGIIVDLISEQEVSLNSEKEKMLSRASNATCSSCHAVIDAMGWTFTEFGPGGEPVGFDPDGDPLNTEGTLYGTPYENAFDMVDILVDQSVFESCFASKFLIHSIGRKVNHQSSVEDSCAVNTIIEETQTDNVLGLRDFIKGLLKSQIATSNGTITQ